MQQGSQTVLIACGALAVALGVAAPTTAQTTPASASRVLVMPFEPIRVQARSYWLREGSAVMLTDGLLALGLPAMRREERQQALDLLGVPSASALSYASVIRVGQMLGASHVVVGSYDLVGNEFTVRARSILLDTGSMGPEIVERGPLEGIFDIYDRVAIGLVPGAAGHAAVLAASHPPLLAFEQFVKGVLAEAADAKLAFLREALRLDPAFERVRAEMWGVHTAAGDHESALGIVEETPEGHPLTRHARFLASVSMVHLERYAEAYGVLTRLSAESPDATLLNNLGVVQLRRRDGLEGGRAVSFFGAAAELDGVDSFFNLGYAYWLDGDAEAAIYWLREAVRRDPADDAAHFVLGSALARLGRSAEAARERELAQRLSTRFDPSGTPGSVAPDVPTGLERLRMDLGLPSALRVENVIEAASQREREQLAHFHRDAGRLALEEERDLDAVAELRRAVYLTPYDHEGLLLLGRAYLRGGRVSDAIQSLTVAIWSTDTTAARLALAEAYRRSGALEEARREVEIVLVRTPADEEARQLLESLAGR